MFSTLVADDGHKLECWIEPAKGPAIGGLVILQEIFGVTDQLKEVAASYAAQGLNVAIPALFDRQERGCVVPFDKAPVGRDLMLSADADAVMLDTKAAVDALKAMGSAKVAVMGFCWGGGLAVRAAQELDIACGISFYGTRMQALLDAPLKAPVQGHFGKTDDHTPADVIAQGEANWPGFEVHWYDAGHAFANQMRPAVFNPEAAALAHERAADFMRRYLA